ncbi:MAG: hypothetical protein IKD58_06845 [Loktanella sp.]|nr:hypothetical protein [Loktanella sp.]
MKPQLILHIGHPKTGTTSIQKTLSAARTWLQERNVLYPQTSLIPHNHRVLGPSVFGAIAEKSLSIRLGLTAQHAVEASIAEWDAVSRQINDRQPKTVILSAEGFFGAILTADPKLLQEAVQQITDQRPRILAYVRSPVLYYLSKAQQKLKGGWGLILPHHFRRLDAIDAYRTCFGVGMEIRTFERNKLLAGDVVSDFAEWIGYPELVPQFSIEEENTSISAEAMSVLHRLARVAAISDIASLKAQRQLTKVVKRLDERIPEPTKPVLHANVTAYITKLNADLIGLRDQYDIHFKDIDYSLVGQDPGDDVPIIQSVEDFCTVNKERRDLLEAKVLKVLAGGRSR